MGCGCGKNGYIDPKDKDTKDKKAIRDKKK